MSEEESNIDNEEEISVDAEVSDEGSIETEADDLADSEDNEAFMDDFELDDFSTEEKNGLDHTNNSLAGIGSTDVNMDTLLKVPVSLAIEVGRKRMPISELLETQEGSVIELERSLDEPLDILVNGALIAHGVVVLTNDKFGIQITDIVTPEERIRSI